MAEPGVELVQQVKDSLTAHGLSLEGPCGAFLITQAVAWQLRDKGFGLLKKPTGNNCDGYSVDYVVQLLPSFAQGFDILGDAGGANVPAFNTGDVFPKERFAVPMEPDYGPASVTPPGVTVVPAPTTPVVNIEDVVAAFEHLMALVQNLTQQVVDLHTRVQTGVDAVTAVSKKLDRTYHGNIRYLGGFDLTPVEKE